MINAYFTTPFYSELPFKKKTDLDPTKKPNRNPGLNLLKKRICTMPRLYKVTALNFNLLILNYINPVRVDGVFFRLRTLKTENGKKKLRVGYVCV